MIDYCSYWLTIIFFYFYLILSECINVLTEGCYCIYRSSYEHSIWKSKSQSAFSHEHGSKSVTGIVQRSMTQSNMAIAELQAKLQQKGESDWRKRHNSSNATEEIRSIYNVRTHYFDFYLVCVATSFMSHNGLFFMIVLFLIFLCILVVCTYF